LDVFTIKLTVEDSVLNEDSETKTYIIDECPICTQSGGGPAIPQMVDNRSEPAGEITLIDMTMVDMEKCPTIIKATIVYEADSDGNRIMIKTKLSEKK
jgi:hypothetical protein